MNSPYNKHGSLFFASGGWPRMGGVTVSDLDFTAAAWFIVSAIVRYKFTEREILVLLRVSQMSFQRGRPRGCFPSIAYIARLTGIAENKTRGILDQLSRKRVLQVLDREGNQLHGKAISKKGYFYGIMANPNFWEAAPRYNFTPELEALELWLMKLRPDEPDPQQPALLPREETFTEGLQATAAESVPTNISPRRGADPGAIRPDRSSPFPDTGSEATGGPYRDSAGSVPDDQAMPAGGFASPPLSAEQVPRSHTGSTQVRRSAGPTQVLNTSQTGPQVPVPNMSQTGPQVPVPNMSQTGPQVPVPNMSLSQPPKKGVTDDQTSQKGSLDEQTPGPLGDSRQPPKKGGTGPTQVPNADRQRPTSQKGRFEQTPGPLSDSCVSPKKGGLLPAQTKPPKKATSQKGSLDEQTPGPLSDSRQPPFLGVLPPRARGRHVKTCSGCLDASSKKKHQEQSAFSAIEQSEQVRTGGYKGGASRRAEVEIMARIRQLHGEKAYGEWGGYWRKWYRLKPTLVEVALDRLILRLDNPEAVEGRGAWMRDQFERLKKLQM
jgi:hypothetical protein